MDELLSQLRDNFRLRLGLWLIAAIVAGYGLNFLEQQRQQLSAEYRNAALHLQKLQSVANQQEWQARAAEMAANRTQIETRLWQANSKGLAQATLQTWLDQQINAAAIAAPRLKVESAIEKDGLWQVSARLDGSFSRAALEKLLLLLWNHPQWIIVNSLELQATGNARFSLVASAYFQALPD
jgi:hypothetical protein